METLQGERDGSARRLGGEKTEGNCSGERDAQCVADALCAPGRDHRGNGIRCAARKYFDSANAQIVIVGDRAQIESQVTPFGTTEVYDAQGNRI